MVSWRRGLTMLAMAVSIIGLDGPAYAGSVGAGGTATANAGTVTLTRSLNLTTQNADFALTFQGRVTDHGWSYVGTLTGTGSTWGYGGEVSQPPYLAMTSGDGSVSGWCSGGSETGVLGADTLNMATPDMEFQCVLARTQTVGGFPHLLDGLFRNDHRGLTLRTWHSTERSPLELVQPETDNGQGHAIRP